MTTMGFFVMVKPLDVLQGEVRESGVQDHHVCSQAHRVLEEAGPILTPGKHVDACLVAGGKGHGQVLDVTPLPEGGHQLHPAFALR